VNEATIRQLLAENLWRLAKSSHNEGKDTERLVRYIPDVKREGLRDQVRFLVAYGSAANQEPATTVTSPMVDGRPWSETPGVAWTVGRIFLDVDQEGRLGLYQILWRGNKTLADVETENGCQYRVTATWYFDVATIADLPAASSGVTYSRSQILVDDETGSYTYSIERRERLYQVIPEHVSRVSPGAIAYREQHLGVRAGDVDENGSPVTLPSMETTQGWILSKDSTKQPDCTTNHEFTKDQPKDQTRTSADRSAADDRQVGAFSHAA
jgi:hypothetical protein